MIRIFFKSLREDGKTYKANLHSHTIISDGHLTAEEMKKVYQEHGYSAVAFTDHDLFVPHNDLTDENFVALNGAEYGVNSKKYRKDGTEISPFLRPCFHSCFIAKDKNRVVSPIFKKNPYLHDWGNQHLHEQDVVWKEDGISPTKEDFYQAYDEEDYFYRFAQMGHEEGFFVTYNHATWSGENYPVFSKYKGMDAVEIVNGADYLNGGMSNISHFQDFHALGQKVYCFASDDNHNAAPESSPKYDSFAGFVRIAAKNLTYEDLIKSLEDGLFYAGTGMQFHESPEFKEITWDDETRKLSIRTSSCKSISYIGIRSASYAKSERAYEGKTIEAAEFIIPKDCHAVWVIARDEEGFSSYSQVYYFDGLEKEKELPPHLLSDFNGEEWK